MSVSAPLSSEDPEYRRQAEAEAAFWAASTFSAASVGLGAIAQRALNRTYTGDPDRTWLDDLIARGPFDSAAVLGCNDGTFEVRWLEAAASHTLDVYELSAGVRRRVEGVLRERGLHGSARFLPADLNFTSLPTGVYDVVWSSGCFHHVIALERLADQVAAALRPGGLLAIQDYVGEPRLAYDPRRLARVNAALAAVPSAFRRVETAAPPAPGDLSPFCGVRADEILDVLCGRFEIVHLARAGALFPLTLLVDLTRLEHQAPDALARLLAAEDAALADPAVRPCAAYAVFRRR